MTHTADQHDNEMRGGRYRPVGSRPAAMVEAAAAMDLDADRRARRARRSSLPGAVARSRQAPPGAEARVRALVGGLGQVRGVRELHAQPRHPRLSGPDHQPRWWRLLPDQRGSRERPRSEQPAFPGRQPGVPIARSPVGASPRALSAGKIAAEVKWAQCMRGARPPKLPRSRSVRARSTAASSMRAHRRSSQPATPASR